MLRPICIWITGLPAAGKSTLAIAINVELKHRGASSIILDGDAMRAGLNRDLGYGATDRSESTRRAGEVARLMVDAGLIAIVALISPFRKDRAKVRARFSNGAFFEVYLDTPAAVCEQRDPKGHYRQARTGQIAEFTGVSSPYEPPLTPEITASSLGREPSELAAMILDDIGLRTSSRP